MAQSDNIKMLRFALVILGIVSIVYGLGFLIVPGMVVTLSGGNPVDFGWLRWSGGILLAIGIGALMASQKPEKQGVFVFTVALSMLLGGLGLLYSWMTKEYSTSTVFVAVPTVLMLGVSCLLWWGRQNAKGIL